MKLLLVVFLIGSFLGGLSAETCNKEKDVGKLRLTQRTSIYDGVLQICNFYRDRRERSYVWDYVTTNNWNDTTAQVACRQLGFPHLTAKSFSVRLSSWEYQVTGLGECDECEGQLYQCLPQFLRNRGWETRESRRAAALNCYCSNGALRLVGGSTHREGRVEVCVDGRWGTVCRRPDWTAEVAGFMCSQLGFSENDAVFGQFEEGSGPVYSLTCNPLGTECTDLEISPQLQCEDHSMDTGVRCQALENTCTTITNNKQIPELGNTTETAISPETTSKTSSLIESTGSICQTDKANDTTSMSSNQALGALTGLLAAALVAVTMGWIVSCVYWWRRVTQSKDHTHNNTDHSTGHHHSHNPMCNESAGTHSQTNYSSLGPAYDHVQTNYGTDYDVINRRGSSRPHPPVTQLRSRDLMSDQGYGVLEENNYHVLESSTMAGEEHSVERANVTMAQGGAGRIQQEPPNEQDLQNSYPPK